MHLFARYVGHWAIAQGVCLIVAAAYAHLTERHEGTLQFNNGGAFLFL